jgi:hypothetical protein
MSDIRLSKQAVAALGEILDQSLNRKGEERLGFAVILFQFGDENRMASYISNAERDDMIRALRETVERLERCRDFPTPESN